MSEYLTGDRCWQDFSFSPGVDLPNRESTDLLQKVIAMFSAIKRVVRENIGCSSGQAAGHGVFGAAQTVSNVASAVDSLPKFKTRRPNQTLL
jgi:hypothetical protein